MEHKESGAGQPLRKKRACRKRIRAVLALLGVSMICALAACVVVLVMQRAQEDTTVHEESTTAQATIETIQKTVFGSGEVQPLSQPGVYAETDGKAGNVLVEVGDSVKAGVYLVASRDGKHVFVTGHAEYDADTLKLEYERDTARGLNPQIPYNYFPEDDPTREPMVRWRAHGNLLFSNWLNYYVYQETPYDIDQIGKR